MKNVPEVADPVLSAGNEPADRNGEYPPKGFVRITDIVKDAVVDLRYYTSDNFTGAPLPGYRAPRPVLSIEAGNALKAAADSLRESGFRIVVYDAYRPLKAVRRFIEWAEDPDDPGNRRFFPELSKRQILERGYVCPRSAHSRGSAIDLGLCNMPGEPADMGTDFDFFGTRSRHGADVSPVQSFNRTILRNAMERAGFLPVANEWWHYGLADEPYPDTYWDFDIE